MDNNRSKCIAKVGIVVASLSLALVASAQAQSSNPATLLPEEPKVADAKPGEGRA